MRHLLFVFSLTFILSSCNQQIKNTETEEIVLPNQNSVPVLVIHAGAGSISPGMLSTKEEQERDSALHEALHIGYEILNNGGTAMQAVEKTIMYMEDCPYFNAGKGSVFNANGEVENDASIMDGTSLTAGAVAGIKGVKNPILLAKLVKDSTKHVMLRGEGASVFADKMGVTRVNKDYFFTEQR